MRRILSICAAGALLAAGLVSGAGAGTAPANAAPAYTVQSLHFKVDIGPQEDQSCDIVGDLYVPDAATATNRMPAIMSTNGFGGSKDDQAGLSKYAAENGYVVLTYSGLGFGGSSCDITLDDPDYDGKAAAQLIDYLGGADGIAFKDKGHSDPAPALDVVELDGEPAEQDPRVGMVGGSYGGQVQYAAASVTAKLDTIIPIITWNDLSYSLGPNNTDLTTLPGQQFPGVSAETPGAVKLNWALGFAGLGAIGDLQHQQPENPLPCPNLADFVCPALIRGAVTGTLDATSVQKLRHASVSTYMDKVRIPTLILQGQADTLFNLNEATATYQALKAQGTPVKMSWVEHGHSGPAAPGELDLANPDPTKQHITKRIFDWLAHYLKDDAGAPTGPEFSYFRNWIDYQGAATPAYAESASFPVGRSSTYYLSSTPTSSLTGGTLVTRQQEVTTGSQAFTTIPIQASDAEDLDVISTFFERPEQIEHLGDLPATFATYDTGLLSAPVDVVGSPQVRLQVNAPLAAVTQVVDEGKLVLYLKVEDVAPGGRVTVVRNLAAPVRVPDVGKAFTVTMPAFVHRFEPGHRIRLAVTGASPNHRGSNLAVPVELKTSDGGNQTEGQTERSAATLPLQSITLPTLDEVPGSDSPQPDDGSGGDGDGDGEGTGDGGASDDGRGSGGVDSTSGGSNGDQSNHDGSGTESQSNAGANASNPQAVPDAATTEALPNAGGPYLAPLLAGLVFVGLGVQLMLRRRRAS